MPTNKSRPELRISLLFAAVLFGVDLLIDILLMALPLPAETALRLVAFKDFPLDVAYVVYLYVVLRREFEMRAAAEGDRLAADARLYDIVDVAPVAMIGTDEEFCITLWNPAAERMYGWASSEVLGKPANEVLRFEMSSEERARAVATVQATGEFVAEFTYYNREGEPLTVLGDTITLHNREGKITGYLSVNRDMTGERAIQQRLPRERNASSPDHGQHARGHFLHRSRPTLHIRKRRV